MSLISFGILVYDDEKYIERALLSALNQSYQKIEFLIVDDRGPGKSIEIVKKIISTHPRGEFIRIIAHEQNSGTGVGRNTVIENAKGDYVFFMDSDDKIDPNCIQLLYDEIVSSKVDVVSGSINYISSAGSENPSIESYYMNEKEEIVSSYFSKFPIYIWNKLYRLSFLINNNIKCIPGLVLEDPLFTYQVLLNAHSVKKISNLTYTHYVRKDSSGDGGEWRPQIFEQWPTLFRYQLKFANNANLSSSISVLLRIKLFWLRVYISKKALNSSRSVERHINNYLNISYMSDKYIFYNLYLLICFLISSLPLPLKKIFILAHCKWEEK